MGPTLYQVQLHPPFESGRATRPGLPAGTDAARRQGEVPGGLHEDREQGRQALPAARTMKVVDTQGNEYFPLDTTQAGGFGLDFGQPIPPGGHAPGRNCRRALVRTPRAVFKNSQARGEIEQKLSQWNAGKPDSTSARSAVPDDRQKTNQVQSEEPGQELDLYGLIVALGERALNSIWFGSGVDCYGETAEDLYAFTNHNRPIEGPRFP